jgi:hypothetical protein
MTSAERLFWPIYAGVNPSQMPQGTKTKPNIAQLSAGLSFQSNQGLHRMTTDVGSEIKDKLGDSEGYAEHLRVMMQTRVAVRDKIPHRFQIVPLREAGNLALDQTPGLNVLTTPIHKLHHSPSGKLGPYSQIRILQSTSPSRFLNQPNEEGGDVRKLVARDDDSHLNTLAAKLNVIPPSVNHPRSRKVLADLDLNRDTGISMATTKFVSKPVTTCSLSSRDLRLSVPHTEAFTTPRVSNSQPRQEEQHRTLSAHISQISQLFSSENVAPPPMRRNRSMTVSSIPSDASVGMSDMSHETEARLKRRHAIYRESSCMPYQASSFVLDENIFRPRLEDFDQDACLAGPLLQPPFEYQKTLAGRPRTPHFSDGVMPVRPLEFPKHKHLSRRTVANRREIVYPRIVLYLFRDIDEAIAQWAEF